MFSALNPFYPPNVVFVGLQDLLAAKKTGPDAGAWVDMPLQAYGVKDYLPIVGNSFLTDYNGVLGR